MPPVEYTTQTVCAAKTIYHHAQRKEKLDRIRWKEAHSVYYV